METYYRKRSKKPLTKMGAEQGIITDMQSPVLGRHHHVPPPPSSEHCTDLQLEVGSVYEIDHVHLPPRTPAQLRSIRVAMVCEMTEVNVAVRYPSMESLRAFFSFSKRETHPTLDEKFVMGTALAANVLVRLVPVEVFSEQKGLECFWLISSDSNVESRNDGDDVMEHKKGGFLFDQLKSNGGMRWGIRRQVKYLGKHRGGKIGNFKSTVNVQNLSTSFVNGEEDIEEETEGEDEEEAEEEENGDDDVEEEEEENEEKIEGPNENLKRKRDPLRNSSKKKPKIEEQKLKMKRKKKKYQIKNKSQAIVLKNPKDRWSHERYKQAEKNLLEVMKAQEATAEKPVLRPKLRAEARKRIGDTGLLDHLLKHMAGKLVPGGELRFRRRHNADGAMQYWLESAELVNIRKEAGVTDSYWVPPSGWKLGDSPNQDPICARELKLLKDEIEYMKRNMDLVAIKELEEEVGKLRREVEELSTKRRQEENQITTLTSSSEISQKLEQIATSFVSSKSGVENHRVTLEKYKEQMLVITDFVKEIEGNVGKIIFDMDEKAKLNSLMAAPADEQRKAVEKEPNTQQEVQAINAPGQETSKLTNPQNAASSPGPSEQKAAKIQRLKSGFRICKPQGTFLWPDMVKQNNININVNTGTNNNVMVQFDVPTPPSVSSSTATAPPQLPWPHHCHLASLVKPKPEKRAVTVTVSSPITAALINLNDAPVDPAPVPLFSATTNTGSWEGTGFGPRNVMGSNGQKQHTKKCSSSSASSFPWWAALSTPKSVSDESRNG